jgi:hypothetical protein
MTRMHVAGVRLLFLALALALPVAEASGQGAKAKLDRKINLENGIDANTPLKDALEFLADKYQLNFTVDSKAFAKAGIQLVEEQPVKLAPMKNVTLARVVELLTAQVQGTYLVERDRVLIVPRKNK